MMRDLIYQVTLLVNWESSTGLLLEVVIDWVDKYRLIQGKINLNKLPMLNFPSIGRKSEHRKLILTNFFLPVSTGICRQPVVVLLYSIISSSSKKNRYFILFDLILLLFCHFYSLVLFRQREKLFQWSEVIREWSLIVILVISGNLKLTSATYEREHPTSTSSELKDGGIQMN